MKKLLLILAGFLSFHQTFAQMPIPNAGFENWANHIFTLTPNDYFCSNDFYATIDRVTETARPEGVTKFTPSHSGDYAVKVSNVIGRSASDNSVRDTLTGFMSSLKTSEEEATPGFPCNQRPTTLNGYYQFYQGSSLANKDTAVLSVILTKWNDVTEQFETIGRGQLDIYMTQSAYLYFTVPIEYISTDAPDTAFIDIRSSKNHIIASPATYLVVDDLNFGSLTTGVKASDYAVGLVPTLYPNPVISDVIIKNMVPNASTIHISDITGHVIQTIPVSGETAAFRVDGLKSGMYMYSLLDASNNILYSDKFAKTE